MADAVLTITMTEGQISVTGPIQNRLLCYGLLEVAREVIQKSADQQERLVQSAPLAMVTKIREN